MALGIARIGDQMSGDGGERFITDTTPSDGPSIDPAVRRCYSGAQLVAIKDDCTKAPHHDWEWLEELLAVRTFLNGKPVAMMGSKDTGDHEVIVAATRTLLGAP